MNLAAERRHIDQAKTDPQAFGPIFDAYYPVILRYVFKRVADPAVAQDIVAETFLKAYQNLHRFTWRDVSIVNWFYKIAINELRSHFRGSRHASFSLDELHETSGFEPIGQQNLAAEIIDAQKNMQREQQFLQAQAILASLPVKYQEVISLRFFEEKKLGEIAIIIGRPENTVKTLLYRGIRLIRTKLSESNMKPNPPIRVIGDEGKSNNGVPEIV
jgi:RNA polymerase sigma-70 factor (ECF subfamily)